MSSNYSVGGSNVSATSQNWLAMAAIPCNSSPAATALASVGKCLNNVDGQCMKGGIKIAGTTGLQLASMGYPTTTCATAGLFWAPNQKYSLDGSAVSTNAMTFLLARSFL
jgi:hypothetical protein